MQSYLMVFLAPRGGTHLDEGVRFASLSSLRFYQHVRFSPDNLFSDQSLPMNCFCLHKGALIVYKVGREHANKMAFRGGGIPKK